MSEMVLQGTPSIGTVLPPNNIANSKYSRIPSYLIDEDCK